MDSTPTSPGHHMKLLARRQFGDWAHSYDRSLLGYFLFEPTCQAILEAVCRQRSNPPAHHRVLDVGCGTGTLAHRLVGADLDVESVVGLDFALPMCQQADAKARRHNHNGRVTFINGDSEHLPFPDGAFDFVTCANSFHHYPHQARVVAEFHRVLRPGGTLLLADGFRDNVIGWFVYDVCIAAVEQAVHHAKWTEIRAMLAEAGFTSVTQRKLNFWFPVLLSTATA
jgi:ubiquinone/menaquinone biosynthesis C-methylase UbiE